LGARAVRPSPQMLDPGYWIPLPPASASVPGSPPNSGLVGVGTWTWIRDALRPSTRPLPDALPAGAPLDIVGTGKTTPPDDRVPNIVKNGTPQNGEGRHARTRRGKRDERKARRLHAAAAISDNHSLSPPHLLLIYALFTPILKSSPSWAPEENDDDQPAARARQLCEPARLTRFRRTESPGHPPTRAPRHRASSLRAGPHATAPAPRDTGSTGCSVAVSPGGPWWSWWDAAPAAGSHPSWPR
jgi:hypothetical protein